jgi:hypothetical protein
MADLTRLLDAKAIDLGGLAIRVTTAAAGGRPNPMLSLPFFDAATGSLDQSDHAAELPEQRSIAAAMVDAYALPLDDELILKMVRRARAAVLAAPVAMESQGAAHPEERPHHHPRARLCRPVGAADRRRGGTAGPPTPETA